MVAAGCTIVLKPAESTPLCAIEVFRILEEAGMPAGVANPVTTSTPAPVGEEFCTNPVVRKLSFTGSTEVGRKLYQSAAAQFKRVSRSSLAGTRHSSFSRTWIQCTPPRVSRW